MNKNDLRSKKTEHAIKNSFFELMADIGFAKMTVSQIITKADINRSTFYAHYYDKFNLLECIENDLLNELYQISRNAPYDIDTTQSVNNLLPADYTLLIVNYIYKNGKLFTLLCSDKGDSSFINKFKRKVQEIWTEHSITDKFSIPTNYVFSGFIGLITALIEEWVQNNFQESPKQFTEITTKFINGFHHNILK